IHPTSHLAFAPHSPPATHTLSLHDALPIYPPPPPHRAVRLLRRQIDVTAQNASKEYLTLRNGLIVRRRYEGLRFWYGTGPFVLLDRKSTRLNSSHGSISYAVFSLKIKKYAS